MKVRFVLTLVICLGMVSSLAFADQSALTAMIKKMPGLTAYYPLEGDLKDVGPNGIDGIQVGDPAAFGWTDGVNGGQALIIDSAQFNGSFIDIPAPIGSPFDTPSGSSVLWVKLNAREGWQAISERSNLWYVETEANPAEWQGNSIVWRIYDPVAVGSGGEGQMRDNVDGTILNDEWYQIGWTFDGLTMTGFINGVKIISKEFAHGLGPIAETPEPAAVGKANYNLSLGTWQQRDDWFSGAIDDFAYFNTALTEDEMMELYNVMMSGATPVTSKDKVATLWGGVKAE